MSRGLKSRPVISLADYELHPLVFHPELEEGDRVYLRRDCASWNPLFAGRSGVVSFLDATCERGRPGRTSVHPAVLVSWMGSAAERAYERSELSYDIVDSFGKGN